MTQSTDDPICPLPVLTGNIYAFAYFFFESLAENGIFRAASAKMLAMNDANELVEMERLFLALADKTRLRLLNLMREREICVAHLTEILGESQPKISRHLAYLRQAGVVEARRDGKWIHYRLVSPAEPGAARILAATLAALAGRPDLQNDCAGLAAISASGDRETTAPATPANTFAETNINRRQSPELEIHLL